MEKTASAPSAPESSAVCRSGGAAPITSLKKGSGVALNAKIRELANFAWGIADLLRGDFKQSDYGKIILPFTILRRLDCLLEGSADAVAAAAKDLPEGIDDATRDMILFEVAQAGKVYNTSGLTMGRIKGQNPADLHRNLMTYIMGFSSGVRDIFVDKFLFTEQLKRLKDADLLWQAFERFTTIDLSPDRISNLEMGYVFEELIRRFAEISNETAGEHFTPREIIKLIVDVILSNDKALTGRGVIRTVYDPASGTGGMLSIAEASIKEANESIRVELFGQELNPESYAICRSDMLVTGHDPEQIAFGNTLTADAHKGAKFHYMISNPPYGVDWKKYADPIKEEAATLGWNGRFGAGLPRVSDGQLLFLQHMVSKMRDDEHGSKIGIVMNGSPLFTGGAGSGESEIRRWLFEEDLVEAIIALPTDIFYNTAIQTYAWILTNRKEERRRGKVQLVDASTQRFWQSMRKSLGAKRREIIDQGREDIVRIYSNFLNGDSGEDDVSKIFKTSDFGYREIRVEKPLRLAFQVTADKVEALKSVKGFSKLTSDEREATLGCIETCLPTIRVLSRDAFDKALTKALKGSGIKPSSPLKKLIMSAFAERDEEAEICLDAGGAPEADPALRDFEFVPLNQDWREFFTREVTPFSPDAWADTNYVDPSDGKIGRVGYEINFNRHFYRPEKTRPLAEIGDELKALEAEIAKMLAQVAS